MADEVLTYAIKMDTAQATPALKDMGETAKEADADVLRLASDLGKLSEAEVRTAAAIRDAKTSLDNQASALGLSRGEFQRMQLELNKLLDAENAATQATKANAAANKARSEALSSASGALSLSRTQLEAIGDQAGKTAQSFKSSAGAIQAAGSNLRSQFLDVAVSLQGGLNPLTVFSQQGPQIAEALGNVGDKGAAITAAFAPMGAALKAVLALWAPLGLAVAAVASAYAVYSNETERAEEKSKRFVNALDGIQEAANKAADALDAAQSSWSSFQGQSASLMSKAEVLTGAKTQAQADLEQQVKEIEAQTQPRIEALNQEVNALSAEIQVRRQEINAAREDQKNMSFAEIRASTDRIKVLENEIVMAETRRQQRKEQISAAEMEVEQVKLLAEVVLDLEGAEARRTEYTKIATKEAKAQTKELEKQAAEVERLMAAQMAREAARFRGGAVGAQEALGSLRGLDSAALARAEQTTGLSAADLTQMVGAAKTADEFEALIAYIQALIEATKEAEGQIKEETKDRKDLRKEIEDQAKAERERRDAMLSQAGSVIGSVAGGDVSGILSMMGPQGALVSQITNLVRSFADPENNPLTMVQDFIEELTAGLSQLPIALSRQLPQIVDQTLPEFLDALTDNLDDIVISVIKAVAQWQTEGTALLISKVDDIILFILKEVILGALEVDEGGMSPIIQAAGEAAKDLVLGLVKLLFNPETWRNASSAIRENIGTALGELISGGRELKTALGVTLGRVAEAIGDAVAQVFTVDFWREAIASLIEAIREFRFSDIDTPGLDAFRSAAGFQERERQTLGQRIDAVRDGAGGIRSVVVNVSGVIGDGRDIRRHLRNLSFRRDGVGSVG